VGKPVTLAAQCCEYRVDPVWVGTPGLGRVVGSVGVREDAGSVLAQQTLSDGEADPAPATHTGHQRRSRHPPSLPISSRSGPVAFAARLRTSLVTATAVLIVSHSGVLLGRARLAICRALQPSPGRR
jgi:hypothetical protein